MNGIIYYTKIKDEYDNKNMEHMIRETSGNRTEKRIWNQSVQ